MIQKIQEIIKSREKEILTVFFTVVAAVLAAGLVLVVKETGSKSPIILQENAFTAGALGSHSEKNIQNQRFVASRNGAKYYPADCKASNRIKKENKVFFITEGDAQKAGYSRTKACR